MIRSEPKPIRSSSFAGRWQLILLQPRANQVEILVLSTIFGRNGGLFISSVAEVFRAWRWSSTARRHQVVRPRGLQARQRQQFLAGNESPSICLADLGVTAWRSPVIGGGVTQGPDCFSSFSSRVLFVIAKALSSNNRFLRVSVVKGPFNKMYLPRVIFQCSI